MGDEAGKIDWDGMNGEALQGGLKNLDFILKAQWGVWVRGTR